MSFIWLTKLLLAHFVTDFLLQRKSWIEERRAKHFASPWLYVHCLIAALVAWWFMGWQYWLVALIILVTHLLIDAWKSYMPEKAGYFIADQLLHLLVIFLCWVFTFYNWDEFVFEWNSYKENENLWMLITAFFFLSFPSAIIIGELTKKWRQVLPNPVALGNAGRWIGIIERILILVLLLKNQWGALGLLIAAKSILRFKDDDRTEEKTEYLLIGTLISIGFAIITGVIVLRFLD
jgi:Protein of unknown function (DUF3307)